MSKLVSIVVPVYNVEKYLERCVDSLINQTYKNIEIILVDDGATDNSGELCDKLLFKDSRIKVFHKLNGGLSDARNYGINQATGEYLLFVDSDDWVENEIVEKLYNSIEQNSADISVCGFNDLVDDTITNKRGPVENKTLNSIDAINSLLYDGDSIGVVVWNKLYKKELFEKIVFEFGKLHEDVFFTPKVLFFAKKIVLVDYYGYNYINDRSDSICNKKLNVRNIDSADANYSNYEFFMSQDLTDVALSYYLRYLNALLTIAFSAKYEQNKEVESIAKKKFRNATKKGYKVCIKKHYVSLLARYVLFRYGYSICYYFWRKRWGK